MITDKFGKKLLNKRFILIGEVHGAKENLIIIKSFLSFFIKQKISVILALEWPNNLNSEINKYLTKNKKLRWQVWQFSKTPDGRISKEHLVLLKWLRNKKLRVVCIDEGGLNWNDRDNTMAKI
jgi:hypothetical protein